MAGKQVQLWETKPQVTDHAGNITTTLLVLSPYTCFVRSTFLRYSQANVVIIIVTSILMATTVEPWPEPSYTTKSTFYKLSQHEQTTQRWKINRLNIYLYSHFIKQ